jgi:nucleoside-diphosphate-sugar epimerase
MRILVTGGTGFIGSHLVEALLEAGHDTYCAVRNVQGAAKYLPMQAVPVPMPEILAGRFPFAHGDALMHLAAIRHHWGVSDKEYLSANVGFTERLLELASERVDQFIYCSSVAVFGWPSRGPIDESYGYAPMNSYGKTKVHCEQMVAKCSRESKLNTTIIRPSITYGRRDPTGMLTRLATMIDRGIYATVGSGENRVQLAHVADIVQGFIKALGNSQAFGRDYIITTQFPIRINNLVELVAGGLGKPVPKFRIPLWVSYLAALGLEGCYGAGLRITGHEPIIAREKIQVMATDRHYSISRAQDELGYAPRYDYPAGIKDFISGLRQDGLLKERSCN